MVLQFLTGACVFWDEVSKRQIRTPYCVSQMCPKYLSALEPALSELIKNDTNSDQST